MKDLASIEEAERLLRWHMEYLIRSYRTAFEAVRDAKQDSTTPAALELVTELARDMLRPARREFERYKEQQSDLIKRRDALVAASLKNLNGQNGEET